MRRSPLAALAAVALAVALAPAPAGAGAARAAAPAGEGCLALVGGTLVLPDGAEAPGTVVLAGDRIAAVGAGVPVPAGCRTLDVAGKVVTPGLVEASTQIGLVEVGLEAATVDSQPGGALQQVGPERASFAVADAYNPRSTVVPVTRIAGVTSAVLVPSGGVVSGLGAWVDLVDGLQRDAIQRSPLALYATVGGSDGSRARSLHALRELLDEAETFRRHEAEWMRNRWRDFAPTPADLRAVAPVLDGRLPLVVQADRASDVEAVLRLTAPDRAKGLRLVVAGGAEAWLVAPLLAEAGVPVIVDPLLNAPESFDRVHARADNARLLDAAGVTVILSGYDTHNARNLAQAAGNAVRAGLPRAKALVAITRAPADAFGMASHGRLAAGARANVVVWSGDPLELSSAPEHVLLAGREIPLVSRQTRLRDRYLSLPGSPSPALPLP